MNCEAPPYESRTELAASPKRRRGWRLDESRIGAAGRAARAAADRDFLEWCERAPSWVGVCYFVGDDRIVKIGFSRNLHQRLAQLRGNSGMVRLQLLATAPGGKEREAYYHSEFATHRISGEWFNRCPVIDAEIERLASDPHP